MNAQLNENAAGFFRHHRRESGGKATGRPAKKWQITP
jgi:hypothetical protein